MLDDGHDDREDWTAFPFNIEAADAYHRDDDRTAAEDSGQPLQLVELADWLRAAGLTVFEYPGWETAARVSGGFTGNRPWCVMWHHTASRTTVANDVYYICRGSEFAPIANLYAARSGDLWVCAAGATNTNGKGGPLRFSRGLVPADCMNTYAVSIEIANDGLGEHYPQIQIDAVFAASLTLTRHLGLRPDDVAGHFDYSPGRKIDPARAEAVEGPWQPRPCTSSGTWLLADYRSELNRRAASPPPNHKEIDVLILDHNPPGSPDWTALTFTGTHLAHLNNGDLREKMIAAGVPSIPVVDVELPGLITSAATTNECPPAIARNPEWKRLWDEQRAA